jgi:hypothetical protein
LNELGELGLGKPRRFQAVSIPIRLKFAVAVSDKYVLVLTDFKLTNESN